MPKRDQSRQRPYFGLAQKRLGNRFQDRNKWHLQQHLDIGSRVSNRQIAESTMINKFDILTSLCNDCNSLDFDEHIHTDLTKTAEYYIHTPILSVKETSDNSDSVIVDNEASEIISDTQITDTSPSTNSEHTEKNNLADTSSIRGLKFQRKGMHISYLNIRHLKPKLDDV